MTAVSGFALLLARVLVQAPQIAVGPNVQVSAARPAEAHNEVIMAADPAHANRLVACSMVGRSATRTNGVAAYVSQDGGRSWSAPVASTTWWANDPTCSYGPDGILYVMHKTNGEDRRSDTDYLSIHRSLDGGRTWAAPVHGPQTTDRPYMAVDLASARRGRVYIAYNGHLHGETEQHDNISFRNLVALQGSGDRGNTFTSYVARGLMDQSADAGSNAGMCETKVLSDGTVVILYSHFLVGGRNEATGKPRELRTALQVLRSTDGGVTLEPAVKVADIGGGYNFAHTRGVAASMAVDGGSPRFRDRLYVTWADFTTGRGQILIAHSSDGGKSWSSPRTVNDDAAARGAAGGPDHFMPTVAVNRGGVVGVLWYDRRDSEDNRGYHARFSASLDGGETWLPSVRVSTAANSPQQQKAGSEFLLTGGDTAGLAGAGDGRFHALWIDNRTGVQQAWTAAISIR